MFLFYLFEKSIFKKDWILSLTEKFLSLVQPRNAIMAQDHHSDDGASKEPMNRSQSGFYDSKK